jgi:hypothetical protein
MVPKTQGEGDKNIFKNPQEIIFFQNISFKKCILKTVCLLYYNCKKDNHVNYMYYVIDYKSC